MRHLLHGFLNCVSPPDWIIQRALAAMMSGQATQAQQNQWSTEYTARPLSKHGQTTYNAFNHSIYLDDESLQWAKSNIHSAVEDLRIAFTLPGCERSGPHVDRTRNYTLIYLIENGGEHHETVFYKEKNQTELIRLNAYHVDDYDQLDIAHKIVLPKQKWTLLNAQILHSIENIAEGRISLQIGFKNLPQDLSIEQAFYIND